MIKYIEAVHGAHFGVDDIHIGRFVFNNVHILPRVGWENGEEADFYMQDGEFLFLLTVKYGGGNDISLYESDAVSLRYIFAGTEIRDVSASLEDIAVRLGKLPYSGALPKDGAGGFRMVFSL